MSSIRLPLLSTSKVRTVATSCLIVAAMFVGASEASAQGRNTVPRNFDVLPITITGVTLGPNGLLVNGLVGSTPFTGIPLAIDAEQVAGAACPILNLQLGEIDLNLLGLEVHTSEICLDITAVPGALLGDLLCAVANLLDGPDGLPINLALATLSPADQTRFLNALTSVLDQVFDRATSNQANLAVSGANGGTCNVLNLAIGPLDLNLLGLRVELDDCNDGPVTVDIVANPAGGLLGDLLCSLSNVLPGGATPNSNAVQRLLFQISQLIGSLL